MASIGGLISGMDTATVISQLMRLEAMPQTQLKSRVSAQERQVNALQTLNSKLANIAGKAADLARIGNWEPVKATSDNDKVGVVAKPGATPTSLTLNVVATATSALNVYTTTASLSAVVHTPDPDPAVNEFVIVHNDGTEVALDVGDGKLQSIADALNGADTGLKAVLVKTSAVDTNGDPKYQLQVTSLKTGTTSGFDILDPVARTNTTAFLGGKGAASAAGIDAAITVNGQTLTQSSNTFTALMPGVDVTLAPGASGPATVSLTRDTQSLSDKVKAMVEAANAALSDIDSLTAYNSGTKIAGILSGDSTVRSIRNEILSTVSAGVDGSSLATYGIEVTREGKLTFDSATFTTAYEADPTGTRDTFAGTATYTAGAGNTGTVEFQKASWRTQPGTYSVSAIGAVGTIDGVAGTLAAGVLTAAAGSRADGMVLEVSGDVGGTVTFTQGFTAKFEALAQRASDSTIGTVTAAVKGRNSRIERLNDDIASWDTRLDMRRASLERTYAALEVSLGQLQSQGNWLAGQLAGLPKWSS